MPRHANHEQRRSELADAVCQIILEHGIDKVSVRSVAQTSGWSVGAIRYYFPKQDDLLYQALSRTVERAIIRIRAAEKEDEVDPVARAVDIVCTVAPVSDENLRDLRIWMAFLDRGLSQGDIGRLMEDIWKGGRYYSRRMVASIAGLPIPEDPNETLEDVFLEETTTVLHIMWDGVSFQGVMNAPRLPPDEIRRLSQRILNTIAERIQFHVAAPNLTT
jgi:AcrR family transcriptional regulator